MASENDCGSLTVDAFPSPPRQYINNVTKPSSEDPQPPKPPLHKTHKKKHKNKTNDRMGNTFNISHSTGTHIGPNYTLLFGSKPEDKEESQTKVLKTPDIERLLNRTDQVTKQILVFVSYGIGKAWKKVLRSLGCAAPRIQQLYLDYKEEGIQEVIYQILLDWAQNNPDEAQIGILFKALWKAEEYDVVETMANKGASAI